MNKILNQIDALVPYIATSAFLFAMVKLFLAFAEYVGNNGL